jgi:hypothetical protein
VVIVYLLLNSPSINCLINNHASAINNSDFVSCEIDKLLVSGALVEVGELDISVCSPLSVAKNSSGKQRLILGLRFLNSHLRVPNNKISITDI